MSLEGISQEAPEHEPRPEAYFSVSHLLQSIASVHEDGSVSRHTIAVRGKDLEDKTRYQALGGGAKLRQEAIDALKVKYCDAIRFREGEEHDDARFYVSLPDNAPVSGEESDDSRAQENMNAFISGVLEPFSFLDGKGSPKAEKDILIELSADREVQHDLREAVPELSPEEIASIHTKRVGEVSPIPWKEHSSGRVKSGVAYHRLFHLFDATVPEAVFRKIAASPNIRILSSEDEQSVRVATQEGRAVTELADGSVLVENIFPDNSGNQKTV